MHANQNLSQKQIIQNANKKKAHNIELTQQEQQALQKQQQKIKEINNKRKEEEFDLQRIQQIQQQYLEQLEKEQQQVQIQQEEKSEKEVYQAQKFDYESSSTEEEFHYQDLIENSLPKNILIENKPAIPYYVDSTLPISTVQEEIRYNLQKSDSLLIQTPTGSGKSTQILQILLNSGYENLFMTQPRRVAVFNVYQRVTQLVDQDDQQLSQHFGYAVRGKAVNFQQSNIRIATEGVLLSMLQDKQQIDPIDCIILDEVHELSCNMELLISLLIQIQYQRRIKFEREIAELNQQNQILKIQSEIQKSNLINKPLKLIFMSATVDVTKFFQNKNLFKFEVPRIDLKACLYPIEIHYLNQEIKEVKSESLEICLNILKSTKNGNILIFLPGKSDIQEFISKFNKFVFGSENCPEVKLSGSENFEELEQSSESSIQQKTFKNLYEIDQFKDKIKILPLHGGLSFEQQKQVFAPQNQNKRLIIVATNIAESSVTLPDITYVIDSCLVKQKEVKNDLIFYKITSTSLNSIQQRTGRCGRMGPGKCYRLVTTGQIANFQLDLKPEIQKTDLKDVILQLLKVGVKRPQNFNFISQIDQQDLEFALHQLELFNVVVNEDDEIKLTEFGQKVSQYALPIRLACIAAYLNQNVLGQAFSAVQSVFGFYNQSKGCQMLQKLYDFIEIYNSKSYVESSQKQMQKHINPSKYKEAVMIFKNLCYKNNIKINKIEINEQDLEQLKMSITRWYIDHLCQLQADGTYLLFENVDVMKINENANKQEWISNGTLNGSKDQNQQPQEGNLIVYNYLQASIRDDKSKIYICEYMTVDQSYLTQFVFNMPQLFKLQEYTNSKFIQNDQILITANYLFRCQNYQFILNNCQLVMDKQQYYWYNWVAILIMSQLQHLSHNSIKIIATFDIKNKSQGYVKLVQFLQQYKINNFDSWISISKVMKQRVQMLMKDL